MLNAQKWLDKTYPTAEAKATIKRIGPKQTLQKRIESDLISVFGKGRDPVSTLLLSIDSAINKNQVEENYSLEGPLSLKGFVNLEELDISNQKITALDVSDCLQLRELDCTSNQLSNLDISNNQQIERIDFTNNQLTNINFNGLTKIEKVYCSSNRIANLEFLKSLDPVKIFTLRLDNNKFPAQDLSCFTPFVNLQRLTISNNPFNGSLKPLRNLANLKELGIAGTDIDSGLEYLPGDFFNVNAIASDFGFRGAYFARKLECTGKLAKQLENYKIENDPLRNYDWHAWKQDNQELFNKNDEQIQTPQIIITNSDGKNSQKTEEIENTFQEWEETAKEIKQLLDIISKCHF